MNASSMPLLREELALLPGPTLADGQPSHTLHDPVRNLFFQIDWPTFEVLSRWGLGDAKAIAAAISAQTPLPMEAAQVHAVSRFLDEHQLLQAPAGAAAAWAARAQQRRGTLWQAVLHQYLFFRIPLWRPDRWLTRWAPRLDLFYRPGFFLLTLAALLLGLIEVNRQWERFSATLVDTFTWQGLAGYGLTLAAVKFLHELGHAFTAKRLGCKVPTMGVAFLVMWPVAYTDTNDVWRLTQRRQRLQVAGAGIATELVIAAWATLAWALLPPGEAQSLAFLLATTTWVSTLLINASPFMRFDGYFLLADWLEMPNLHARAFALARWDLRERLFALGEPVPEVFPRRRHVGLILFAYATWVYRLVVFLGIAALVYAFFIKALGLVMFAVEIVWFVMLPLVREVQAWQRRWPVLRQRRRAWASAAGVLMLLGLTLVPWPTRLAASALLQPAEQMVVYAAPHARLQALPVAEGQAVRAGDLLVRTDAPELENRQRSAAVRRDHLRWEAAAGTFDAAQRAHWQVAQQALATSEADLASVQVDEARHAPVAPFDGVLHHFDPDLAPGTWLAAREPIARLVSSQGPRVVAYFEGDDVARLRVGQTARFYADALEGPFLPLTVTGIDAQASSTLPEPELATLYGGSVLVREKHGLLYPEHALYRVTLTLDAPPGVLADRVWRGRVVIAGEAQAPADRYLRTLLAAFWREAGF